MSTPMQKNVSHHNLSIIEKYGITGNQNCYVKPTDQNTFVRLSVDESIEGPTKKIFLYNFCRRVFLPQGYPKSVSDDYFQYQFYDTIQAFASRITGTISTKAILKSVGVGNAEATPLSAAITWIFKDGTGMLGSILFAWWKGTQFDSNCKRWRLFADVLNDLAMALELVLPYLVPFSSASTVISLPLLCVTTCMKAAVGVAGSATRAAVTQHQARADNAADVAAKDGSQETAVNLVASIVGILLLTLVEDGRFEWTIFLLFTLLHLFANFLAVSSLVFNSLNESRYVIILRAYCRFDVVPPPLSVNRSESVVLGHGHSAARLCGFNIKLGQSLKQISSKLSFSDLEKLLDVYRHKRYICYPDLEARTIHVLLLADETPDVVLSSYFHSIIIGLAFNIIQDRPLEYLQKKTAQGSCLLKRLRTKLSFNETDDLLENLTKINEFVDEEVSMFMYELEKQDWNTASHSLEVDDWRIKQFQFK